MEHSTLQAAFPATLSLGLLCCATIAHAQFEVNTLSDDPSIQANPDSVTLREAIASANAAESPATITFAPAIAGGTITLTEGELAVTRSVTIDGTIGGLDGVGVTISGGWDGVTGSTVGSRIFLLGGTTTTTPNTSRAFALKRVHLTRANGGPFISGALADTDPPSTGNRSSNGGCLFVNGGAVTIEESMLSFSTGNDGALIELVDGSITATASTFFDARGRDDGAVFDTKPGTSVTAVNCTFSGNVAGDGGTAGTGSTGSVARVQGTLSLEHCTLVRNRAQVAVLDARNGTLEISRNLLVGNVDNGGGLSIIDIAGGSATDFEGDPLTPDDDNFADFDFGGDFTVLTQDQIALGPLADNGGPTPTAALGCLTEVRDGAATALALDQRGNLRPNPGEPGAYELAGCPDTDGDALLDFDAAEIDDDGDGIPDRTEIELAAFAATTYATELGNGVIAPAEDTVRANGAVIAYDLEANGAAATATSAVGTANGDGLTVDYDPQTPAQTPALTYDFGRPVYDLSFTLAGFDVADVTSGFEEVTVTLFYDTLAVVLSSSDLTLTGSVEQSGNTLTATGTTGGTATLDPLNRPVDRMVLTFGAGAVAVDPAALQLFLSELSFRNPATLGPDADGRPAPLDIDADGDGIVDNAEAQSEADYDVNGAFPPGGILAPLDTDGDGLPDFLDLDSDDDGEFDDVEGHDSIGTDGVPDDGSPALDGVPTGVDVDGDGLDDGYDNKLDGLGADNATNFAGPGTYPNSNNVGTTGDEGNWRDDDANVAGFVFADADGDGIREAGEAGVDGATVELIAVGGASDGTAVATSVVDATGRFLFTDVTESGPGSDATAYYLTFVSVAGQTQTVPADQGADDRVDSDYSDVGGTLRTPDFTVSEMSPAAFFGAGFAEDALPVTFVSVSAEATAECRATVSWTVADERDVSHYRVERLVGEGAWAAEAEVAATGASAYAATAGATGSYYRVVSVDLDGATGRSDVVAVPGCTATAQRASAFPNPATAGATIALAWGETPTRPVTVHEASGRTVRSLAVADAHRLPTAGLPAGVYVARNGAEAVRFVIR